MRCGDSNRPKGACHFPDYPGAVALEAGLQAHRDGPVDAATGNELADVEHVDGVRRDSILPGADCSGLPLLYAHSRRNAKSLPCAIDGVPPPYLDQGINRMVRGRTRTPHPASAWTPRTSAPRMLAVPTSSPQGVAELPVGNFMVTLGFWNAVHRAPIRSREHEHSMSSATRWGSFMAARRPSPPGEAGDWQPGAVAWGNASTPTFARVELQAELPRLDELSLSGSRAV